LNTVAIQIDRTKKNELQSIYLVKELESQLDEINTNIDRAYQ